MEMVRVISLVCVVEEVCERVDPLLIFECELRTVLEMGEDTARVVEVGTEGTRVH